MSPLKRQKSDREDTLDSDWNSMETTEKNGG